MFDNTQLSIEVGRIDGLEEEIAKEIMGIERHIPKALNVVGSEMIEALKTHLSFDFYEQYEPVKYVRRREKPQYGRSLYSDKYTNMNVAIAGSSLQFDYTPNGEHTLNPTWHTRDGDKLIEWAQKEGDGNPVARPFWNRFIHDLEGENGKIMRAFADGMFPDYVVITEESDVVELSDSLLSAEIE